MAALYRETGEKGILLLPVSSISWDPRMCVQRGTHACVCNKVCSWHPRVRAQRGDCTRLLKAPARITRLRVLLLDVPPVCSCPHADGPPACGITDVSNSSSASAPAAAPGEPTTVTSGVWMECRNGPSVYYYNTATQESTWTKPADFRP